MATHPAIPASSSATACWTCKVRRKKCDQSLPSCKDCTFLGLACHYSHEKPAWMDNGTEQQRMAARLKAQVKRNVAHRARRRRIHTLTMSMEDGTSEMISSPPRLPLIPESGRNPDTPFLSFPTPESPSAGVASPSATPSESVCAAQSATNDQNAPGLDLGEAAPTGAHEVSDFEPSLLMSYLDYAFPVLFPFYKPSILEGGRGWLLTLALKFPAFYHNIIGLAAYFFYAVPVTQGPGHDICAAKAGHELQTHMEKAVQGVQDSLRRVTELGVQHCLAENVRLLGNIVQLVNFEVVFASSANWQLHLSAAVGLFDETLRHFGHGLEVTTKMGNLLERLSCSLPSNCSFWSAEQAALRFFAAVLIHQDAIASTTRATAPALLVHYDEVLAGPGDQGASSALLSLEDFTGCPNWVLRSIARTSALNEWKSEAKHAGNLDILDLVQRATVIQQDLRDGNARLDGPSTHVLSQTMSPYRSLESILAKSNITNQSIPSRLADLSAIRKIWAHAAEVYLITVLSGWQPGNAQLRNHVTQTLDHLKGIDNPSWLRSLAWPFCIVGCFATEQQEAAFKDIANASGSLAMFGTMREALAIMEKVWNSRHEKKTEDWDISFCLRILGHSVLLV